jgi:hypothetical protein
LFSVIIFILVTQTPIWTKWLKPLLSPKSA